MTPYWTGKIIGGGKRVVLCLQCEEECKETIGINDDYPKCPKQGGE